jgi:hypothetical protein
MNEVRLSHKSIRAVSEHGRRKLDCRSHSALTHSEGSLCRGRA